MRSLFIFSLFFVLVGSCYKDTKATKTPPSSPPITRDKPKESDPVKQKGCKAIGEQECKENNKCKKICDDIFSIRSDKKDCYELSKELVYDFRDIIKATEKGSIDTLDEIGSESLECMLDIDERAFAKAIKDMNKKETKKFALFILDNDEFSKVLKDEDNDFNILKQILHGLSGTNDLRRALSYEIKEDKGFLWLSAEKSEDAWEWLDDYVDKKCDEGDSLDCPGGENIGAYCNALNRLNEREFIDFISDAEFFAEEYEEEVTDESYEYEIVDEHGEDYQGDFRDFCSMKIAGSSSAEETPSCPNSYATNQFDFVLEEQSSKWIYRHPDYSLQPLIGSSNDNNGLVQFLEMGLAGYWSIIIFNGNHIPYVEDKTYHIYIDDNSRVALEYAPSGGRIRFQFDGDTITKKRDLKIAISSEGSDGQCQFYR